MGKRSSTVHLSEWVTFTEKLLGVTLKVGTIANNITEILYVIVFL